MYIYFVGWSASNTLAAHVFLLSRFWSFAPTTIVSGAFYCCPSCYVPSFAFCNKFWQRALNYNYSPAFARSPSLHLNELFHYDFTFYIFRNLVFRFLFNSHYSGLGICICILYFNATCYQLLMVFWLYETFLRPRPWPGGTAHISGLY